MSHSTPLIASRPARSLARGFTLMELLVVITIIGILAALLMPALSKVKNKAHNAVCLSQLRQLGIATRLYTDDHTHRLPSAEMLPSMPIDPARPLPRICDVMRAYLGNNRPTNSPSPAVFRCPKDQPGYYTREGSSYQWNIKLNGRRMDETINQDMRIITTVMVNGKPTSHSDEMKTLRFPPATTPLFIDYDNFHPRSSGPGKNAAFMDGHTAPLTMESLLPRP